MNLRHTCAFLALAVLSVACSEDPEAAGACAGECAVGGTSSTTTSSANGGGGNGGGGGVVGNTFIPPERLPPAGTWESAGAEGGIPERATICADVTDAPYSADNTGVSSAVASIQQAIDDCPDGQVVFVPAGDYLIDSDLTIEKSITLRGAGSATVFEAATGSGTAIHIGGLGPWPPPKANDGFRAPVDGAMRGSTMVTMADTSAIEVGKMIMIDEEDDPALVWTKADNPGRYRASMHMVESTTATTVTFRPPLPIDYTHTPQISWFPDLTENAGVESIRFVGTGSGPGLFIEIMSAWNVWVLDCELTDMPSRSIMVAWSGHIELRKIFMHDQANGGPNSEGLDLFADVNWSLVVDSICVASGFPQINIGDGGANPYYSGGFGNVIAYNYCVDAYYTDPPDSPDAGKQPSDVGTNHSPHSQYNLVEGNVIGKFGSDGYHGSGSHTVMLRNAVTGTSSWPGVSNQTAIQLDRRNLEYTLVGNVLGVAGTPATFEYATESGWNGTAIFRLGFPDVGNDGYDGTFPPMDLFHSDGGPRDLYVDRDDTANGTTMIEGNWTSNQGTQDWTIEPAEMPESLYLTAKPSWFGSLAWPPVDPGAPISDDPTIIPAGYRYVHGTDP
jgi:pectate lyase-like protein